MAVVARLTDSWELSASRFDWLLILLKFFLWQDSIKFLQQQLVCVKALIVASIMLETVVAYTIASVFPRMLIVK